MNEACNLRRRCLAGGGHAVALVDGEPRTADHLRAQVLDLAERLAERQEQRWAIWLDSPYEFLVAFLAAALSGKDVVLPGNMQAGTARILAPEFDGLISHVAFDALAHPQLAPAEVGPNSAAQPAFRPAFDAPVKVTLYTSGSTGTPKAVAKTLALLEAELNMQQQQWGAQLAAVPVVATVSHQHIYGLLHLVLWPFLRGAAFVDSTCQYPEELLAETERCGQMVLVSSPTHLARLPQSPVAPELRGSFSHIFSSGGLLDTAAALAVAQVVGEAPIEILGSTETGGVAWRQQSREANSQQWVPLPGVCVSKDAISGCLAVSAPHIANAEVMVMGDRVEIGGGGRFALLGRSDTVVKVEGKRLSLTEMESRLAATAWVDQARVTVVQGKRQEVGAVVVLNESGQNLLAQQGKLTLNRQLRDQLLAYFERPLLPRRWRYVDELPYNSQGKVTADALAVLLK